jgi:uncharacterized protein (TIGR02996 family)
MTDASALLADCVATPEDDGPRLVWADHVGSARGEFVVAQCDLARGGLTREAARSRRARERELLVAHAVEWAGDVAKLVDRWSFRRGFVEAVILSLSELDGAQLRAAAPLLGAVSILHAHNGVIDRPQLEALRGIRGLALVGDYIGDGFERAVPTMIELGLRALGLDGVDASSLPAVLDLLAGSPIETLRLRNLRVSARELERMLERVPSLVALELDVIEHRSELVAVAARLPLRAFRLGIVAPKDLVVLADTPLASSVERLGLSLAGDQLALPALPRVAMLELGGNYGGARALASNELPGLRDLRVHYDVTASTAELLEARFGATLASLEYLDEELAVARPHPELLHHDAEAMLTLGTPWHRTAPPVVLVRLDQHEIIELPAMPVDEPVILGRAGSNTVALHMPSLGRRHARLEWQDDHHVIIDGGSANGTFVGELRVDRHPLRDGDEFALAGVRFRYFVGPDASVRARGSG